MSDEGMRTKLGGGVIKTAPPEHMKGDLVIAEHKCRIAAVDAIVDARDALMGETIDYEAAVRAAQKLQVSIIKAADACQLLARYFGVGEGPAPLDLDSESK